MKIELYLYATLAKYLPENTGPRSATLDVDENARIRDVVDRLRIPEKSIKLVFVNGVHGQMDTVVNDGDRVGLFPPVGGG
ncbi:MAG: MoaD/ThiS family protein [Desulfosalsimonadaceae bacterium]